MNHMIGGKLAEVNELSQLPMDLFRRTGYSVGDRAPFILIEAADGCIRL